jgi:hypothetical protein
MFRLRELWLFINRKFASMEKPKYLLQPLASKKLPIGEAVPKKTTLCTPPPPRLDKRQAVPLILVAMKTAWDRLILLP